MIRTQLKKIDAGARSWEKVRRPKRAFGWVERINFRRLWTLPFFYEEDTIKASEPSKSFRVFHLLFSGRGGRILYRVRTHINRERKGILCGFAWQFRCLQDGGRRWHANLCARRRLVPADSIFLRARFMLTIYWKRLRAVTFAQPGSCSDVTRMALVEWKSFQLLCIQILWVKNSIWMEHNWILLQLQYNDLGSVRGEVNWLKYEVTFKIILWFVNDRNDICSSRDLL